MTCPISGGDVRTSAVADTRTERDWDRQFPGCHDAENGHAWHGWSVQYLRVINF